MPIPFAIKKLIIFDHNNWNKDALKVLKQGETYTFAKCDDLDEFFGKNISVCTIVGMNGSGKSSLLDLIYRTINNFAAIFIYKSELGRNRSCGLDYCYGLYLDLCFDSAAYGECSIIVRNDAVAFVVRAQNKVFLGGRQKCDYDDFFSNGELKNYQTKNVELINKSDVKAIILNTFYSVVSNYAMQALVTTDYAHEKSSWYYSVSEGNRSEDATSWIDGLFHKNDGYTTPIVLNPQRSYGKIDMRKEEYLTINRASSLLLYFKFRTNRNKNVQLIDGYDLYDVQFTLNPYLLFEKFKDKSLVDSMINKYGRVHNDMPVLEFVHFFKMEFSDASSLPRFILREYRIDCRLNANDHDGLLLKNPLFLSYIYLVYKTLTVPTKDYPGYEEYKGVGLSALVGERGCCHDLYIESLFEDNAEPHYLSKLIKKLRGDNSHVGLKIRQTLKAISRFDDWASNGKLDQPISFLEYLYKGGQGQMTVRATKLSDIIELMPPPIFSPSIFLKPSKDKNNTSPIDFKNLSSGQKQLIFTISTLIYHSFNILSVKNEDRIRYKNICYILDEIEICFHPEYQRSFVYNLVDTIKRVGLNKLARIQVIISTHSPFILSDIPNGNVLYLKDGYPHDGMPNVLGANINDILRHSFFLENGFMGEFVKRKLLSIIDRLTSDKYDYKYFENDRLFVRQLGDQMIKEKLEELLSEKSQ